MILFLNDLRFKVQLTDRPRLMLNPQKKNSGKAAKKMSLCSIEEGSFPCLMRSGNMQHSVCPCSLLDHSCFSCRRCYPYPTFSRLFVTNHIGSYTPDALNEDRKTMCRTHSEKVQLPYFSFSFYFLMQYIHLNQNKVSVL